MHNTLPLPAAITNSRREGVTVAGKALLAARANHPGPTLADLYEPLATPPDVIAAHADVDRAVDALFDFRRRRWTERGRLELLLSRYAAIVEDGRLQLDARSSPAPVRRRRRQRTGAAPAD